MKKFICVAMSVLFIGCGAAFAAEKPRTTEQVLSDMVLNVQTQLTLTRQFQIVEARYKNLQKEYKKLKSEEQDTCEGECEDSPVK